MKRYVKCSGADASIEDRIYDLVKSQFEKMAFSKTYSNQARLANICQRIIHDDWGISSNYMWKLVDTYVKEFIPDDMD